MHWRTCLDSNIGGHDVKVPVLFKRQAVKYLYFPRDLVFAFRSVAVYVCLGSAAAAAAVLCWCYIAGTQHASEKKGQIGVSTQLLRCVSIGEDRGRPSRRMKCHDGRP